jgi:hypothetical protein
VENANRGIISRDQYSLLFLSPSYNHYVAVDHESLETTRDVSHSAKCEKSGAGKQSVRASCSCNNVPLLASETPTGQSLAGITISLRALRRLHCCV